MFGRYLLVQRLSRGGMGEIFLAKHGLAGFEKLAVIKKVLPHLAADKQFISRFVDEAQVAIKLQHVNVAQVFEVGRVGDEYFLALEYVEGRDLRRTLAVLDSASGACRSTSRCSSVASWRTGSRTRTAAPTTTAARSTWSTATSRRPTSSCRSRARPR